MEASSSATPSNPRYESSAGPSPPPRNSMEDADSSSTRKRPRLDSGNHTMSADRSSATPSQLGSSTAPTTPPLDHPLQSSEHSDAFLSTIDRTPSKVTINVRDQSHHSPSPAPTSHDCNTKVHEHKGGLISPDEGVEPSKAKSPSPRIISVSSSPSRSPEIEVAEVEDINEEPGQTKWRPLVSSVLDAKAVQESLLERFPYLNQARDLPHTVAMLASHFEKNPMSNGDLFQELADWIEDYLSSTELYPTQWYNMYIEEAIFWQTLISIATNLCKRGTVSRHQPQILPLDVHGDPSDHQSFRDFLVAFGALSLRFVQIDCQTLKEFTPGSSTKPDLISEPYLSWLSNIVATNDFLFWKYLHNIYRFDPKRTVTAIIERFICEPSSGLGYLTRYAKDLLDRSQNTPAVTASLWTALSIVNRMLAHYNLILDARNPNLTQQLLILHQLPVESYRLFEEIDKTLQTFISKKASALSHEISQNLVTQLSEMILRILFSSEQMTTSFLKGSINLTEDLNSDEAPIVAEQAWKFQLLKKCLLEGRMEIRVQGVDTMQQELVKVYREHIQHNPTGRQHQVVRFLCDFIISNRLVEYLVGVESHPQLISRCANVIGFLVINNKYTEADSDAIWKAVKMSQDSRVIDAILQMLPVIISLSDYNVLLYLVTKLNETALDSFDNRMINYGTALLTELQKKWGGLRENTSLDLPPYHLCIRLIREAAALGNSLPFAKRRNINAFASTQLLSLLAMGPSHGDKKRIYNECIEEIAENTKFATGSISALNAFLKHDTGTDIMALVHDFALADLIITNFVHTAESASRSAPNLQVIDEALAVRLDLLQVIIMFAPDSISPERGRSLWDAMVGPQALSDLDRDSALAMLVTAIQGSMRRNAFIDRCINEYLPQLAPRYFTQNIMLFITHVIHYESCFPQGNADEDNLNMVPTVTDILWHISLVAPANSIERKAISMLVALYLDTPKAQRTPKATITRMHEEVVERCIRQLTSAALKLKSFSDGTSSGEDEPMIIVVSDDEIDSQKLSFIRSLLILRELVHGIQSRAVYSPIPRVHPEIVRDVEVIKGDPVKIRYQPFSGGKDTGIKIIELGDLETIDALSKRLTALTGFSKFTVIAGGQKVNLVECAESTIRDSKLHEKGLILIKKIIDDDAAPDLTPLRPLKPLEVGVMAHFQDLYQLLSLEERLATDVFEFLVAFPPHDHVVGLLSSADTLVDVVLPPASPYKSYYSLYTLSQSLNIQLANGTSSSDFIRRGIQLMVESLMKDTGIGVSLSTTGEIRATSSLIDCLLKYLKAEHASSEVFDQISLDSKAFVNRLLSLITAAQNAAKHPSSENLISGPFAVILEVSLHSDKVWSAFKETGDPQSLLRCTLLQESRQKIREGIAKAIESICTIPSQESPKTTDFAPYFWEFFTYLIPDSLEYSHNSEQFFTLSTLVFRQLDGAHRQNLDLSNYVREWSALLLRHHHHEFVGRDSLDWVIYGISGLIQLCIQFAKASEKPLDLDDTLMEELFQTHLFPEISQAELGTPSQVRIPTLHSKTRAGLYTILLALSSDPKAYRKLLFMVRNLLRQGEGYQAWSWGIAQIVEDYTYDANWNFDRMCSIRSATGYPGLKNLSNTCYLNSLFTQLFMNVRFRDFVLNTNIADGRESQRLLAETKTLFAFMQESMLKQIDPQGITDSIVTYENSMIDVAIQMDVDEFYNLLFDRLESQILSEDAKKTFRSFYGGQIVQQVKSKECPHISERLEPFSAIQCDIQGKANLTESLNAYVEGEVMEGDNKYSCTSCGCYVDAVKRACLKDIPDNLIFHLKRFDFDISTGNRHKINDKFEFPEKIDMAPYNVDYLQDSDRSASSSDIFELVGILVHHGAAESGHYYSYIRERPTNPAQGKTWVEFNDSEVTEFCPSQIPDQCFGGLGDLSTFSGPGTYSKTWSAYMLFYQRVSSLEAELEERSPLSVNVPIKNTLPLDLETRVAIENEKYLRTYCLFDPAHVTFARTLLEKLRNIGGGTCSDDHSVEKEAIWFSLEFLDHVLSKTKESTDFDRMLDSLTKMIGSCSNCCKLALEWVIDHKAALRSLLLRCPAAKVKRDFAKMISNALYHLRMSDPRAYGFDVDSIDSDSEDLILPECEGVLQQVVCSLYELRVYIHLHSRAWDDYFGLLAEVASFGALESFVLLREEFLRYCLELFVIEGPGARKIRVDNPHYIQFIRLIEKGRRYPFAKLMELLRILLSRIDLRVQPRDLQIQQRPQMENGKFSLSKSEEELLHWAAEPGRSRNLAFLDKILTCDQNPSAAKSIVHMMLLAEPQAGWLSCISKTILGGINIDPASLAAPFLNAALTFCRFCPVEHRIKDMISHIAREVDTIGTNGGKEHLEFFVNVRQIQNQRGIRDQTYFHRLVREAVPKWAPPLIMYWEEEIRTRTVELLKTLVFHADISSMDDEQEAEEIASIAQSLCDACIKRVQDQIIQPQKPVEAKMVEHVRELIRYCLSHYFSEDTAEGDRVTEDAEAVFDALQTLSVEDADDVNSDTWNGNSDDIPTDSESENIMVSP